MLNIVLLEPEIPANTGNIGRTCVAAGARLHLIEPMGFQINEKQVRRAGLDYWDKLDYRIYDSYRDFVEKNPGIKIYMATTKVLQSIALLPPEITIHRLTGDGPKELLLAPLWSSRKREVLNEIHKQLKQQNIWQGKEYKNHE